MNGIKTVTTFDTIYNADTVEWCPVSPYHNFLVCGTYQLNEETKNRFGRLYLLKLSTDSLNVVQELDMAAIPDCKWCPTRIDSKILLAVATTTGQVIVYELKSGMKKLAFHNNVDTIFFFVLPLGRFFMLYMLSFVLCNLLIKA